MLEELPSPLDFNMIKEERNGLIKVFRENPLGNRWIMCIEHEDGIKKIAKYYMNHQNDFTTERNINSSTTFDKICIIERNSEGNAQKYGLKVDYPEDWSVTETTEKGDKKRITPFHYLLLPNLISFSTHTSLPQKLATENYTKLFAPSSNREKRLQKMKMRQIAVFR